MSNHHYPSQTIPLVRLNDSNLGSSQSIDSPPAYSRTAAIPMYNRDAIEGEDREKRCRICFMSSDDDDDVQVGSGGNPFIHPCLCKGSMAYVHLDCLQRWRQERSKNAYTCEVCHYHYDLRRPFWAKIVGSPFLVAFITLVLVLAFMIVLSYLVKVIDVYGFHHYPNLQDEHWVYWHGTTQIMWLDRFYVLIGLCLTGLFGIVFLCFALAAGDRYSLHIWTPNSIMCGGMVGSDAGVLVIVLIFIFGIIAAFCGVFQFVHSILSKVMKNAKERIMDVADV